MTRRPTRDARRGPGAGLPATRRARTKRLPAPAAASSSPGRTAGLPLARASPSRKKPGGPGQRSGGPGARPGLTRRRQRRGRRRATLLALIGAGVLVAAVVLALVLNTILGSPGGSDEISQSTWSRDYGPPQVAGILSSVAFSPSGKELAVGASGGLQSGSQAKGTTYLLNARSGNRITEIRARAAGPKRSAPTAPDAGRCGRPVQQHHVLVEYGQRGHDRHPERSSWFERRIRSVQPERQDTGRPTTRTALSTCGGYSGALGPRPCRRRRPCPCRGGQLRRRGVQPAGHVARDGRE